MNWCLEALKDNKIKHYFMTFYTYLPGPLHALITLQGGSITGIFQIKKLQFRGRGLPVVTQQWQYIEPLHLFPSDSRARYGPQMPPSHGRALGDL